MRRRDSADACCSVGLIWQPSHMWFLHNVGVDDATTDEIRVWNLQVRRLNRNGEQSTHYSLSVAGTTLPGRRHVPTGWMQPHPSASPRCPDVLDRAESNSGVGCPEAQAVVDQIDQPNGLVLPVRTFARHADPAERASQIVRVGVDPDHPGCRGCGEQLTG